MRTTVLAGLAIVGLAASRCPAQATASASPSARPAAASASTFGVVVAGDSYSAGNGAGDYQAPSHCYRSPLNYAGRFVTAINKSPYYARARLTNVACSGAVAADVVGTGPQKRASQVSQIPTATKLVFLTIGGNDGNFAKIVQNCLIHATQKGTACDHWLATAEALVRGGGTSTYAHRLSSVLTKIHARAAHATIVLLGYPYLITTPTYTIPKYHGRDAPKVKVGQRLDALEDAADSVESGAIRVFGATHQGAYFFVSTHGLFKGHGIHPNKRTTTSWLVFPFTTISTNTWFHPKPTGWSHEAALLLTRASSYGVPKNPKPVPTTWPTKNNDGPPVLYAYFGAEFEDPQWVSCLADTSYCIADLDDGYVHVIQVNGLTDVAQVAVTTKNPAGELTGIGFTAAQAAYLLATH